MSDYVLPDSRARESRGVIRSPLGNLVQIFCANCGTPWGMVPEEHITFAFAMCEPCAEKYGDDAHFYKEPDAVFWERLKNAQLEEHGGILSPEALAIQLADPSSAISKLAAEWRRKVEKTEK